MSLKALHMVFIAACLALAIGVGYWSFEDYSRTGSQETLWLGLGCVALGVGTVPYSVWILRKLKRVSYL